MLTVLRAGAAVFWVDFDAGDDRNSGTSTNAPWRTLPGTLLSDDSDLLGSWGPHNSSNPLPTGSVVYLKGGTTWDRHDPGGSCFLYGTGGGRDVYTSTGTGFGAGVVISVTNGWGSGPVILDGSGKTNAIALLVLGMSGITLDGVTSNNIVIRNASGDGIQLKEQHGTGAASDYVWIQHLRLEHCGVQLTNDLMGAGSGHLNLRHANHLRVTKVEVDGAANTNYCNGILLGDNAKWVKDGLVWDCYVHHLRGDPGPNDSGIGFKSLNSQVSFTNVVSEFNLKGMDIGEQSGPGGYDLLNKVWNSTFHSNAVSGIGLTGKAAPYDGRIRNWVFNCVITSNNNFGINCYSAPQQTVIVHNMIGYNGDTALQGAYAGNIRANPNDADDSSPMAVFILNNLLVAPADCQLCNTDYTTPRDAAGSDYTQFSDWNLYVQRADELFAQWAYFNGREFLHVRYNQGPGSPSSLWATTYSNSAAPQARGRGHHGSDTHSITILSGAPEARHLWKSAHPGYRLAVDRPGTNFSAQPWMIPEMAFDRSGHARVHYSIGLYDADSPDAGR